MLPVSRVPFAGIIAPRRGQVSATAATGLIAWLRHPFNTFGGAMFGLLPAVLLVPHQPTAPPNWRGRRGRSPDGFRPKSRSAALPGNVFCSFCCRHWQAAHLSRGLTWQHRLAGSAGGSRWRCCQVVSYFTAVRRKIGPWANDIGPGWPGSTTC